MATDISGSKDLIINQETGILVPPANAANLANGLHDKKTERARILGQNSRAKITAEFDIRLIAEQYISLYEAVSKKDSKLNLPH